MSRGNPNTVLIANPGADLYGSDRMVLETVRALVGDDKRVVVTVPHQGPLVPLLEDAGAEVVECVTPIVRKGLLSPRGLVELVGVTLRSIVPSLRLIRGSNAGVVLVNTITPPLWLPLSRMSGRVTICHVHEGEASVSPLLRRALYVPLVFCNRILINSAFSLRVLARSAPWLERRTTVIYNAVAGPPRVVAARAELVAPTRFVYVGRLSARKGPHVAIEAMKILVDSGHDVHLSLLGAVFPGNEAYADSLDELVTRLGLSERVTSLGFKPDVWDDLAEGDIVLIPSTVDEPFGNTAVEAALAGRPAVVSRVGGLPEAAGHSQSAILVPPHDAAALATAAARIIDEWPRYSALAAIDASEVASIFSHKQYANAISDALAGRS
jgi:glycosyltransferase involved in cell wall biosynthesis